MSVFAIECEGFDAYRLKEFERALGALAESDCPLFAEISLVGEEDQGSGFKGGGAPVRDGRRGAALFGKHCDLHGACEGAGAGVRTFLRT